MVVAQDESSRQVIAGISARLDEVAGVIVELERQLKGLQAGTARSGRPRPILRSLIAKISKLLWPDSWPPARSLKLQFR